MKKPMLLSLTLLLALMPLAAQQVTTDNFDRLQVHFATPGIRVATGDYLTLSADGYILGGEVGAPALPMACHLLTVPLCDSMVVTVTNAVYDTLALPAGRVMPLQPSRSKSDRSEPSLIVDEELYATDAYFGKPLATVTSLGIARDRRYANLCWSPVQVNPVQGTLIVCRSADVTVSYIGSNEEATRKLYERYHTPAFSIGETLNNLFTYHPKDATSSSPLRMVIVAANSLQCTALDEFAQWKRKQGMLVDIVYHPNATAAATIASALQTMYDEASAANPAPTYLILVGDHQQVRAFSTSLSASSINTIRQSTGNSLPLNHITDHYYTTWTEDNLPDCYQGRFSATDTTTLRNIIEKTIYYERYQFMSDSYLDKAVLVAGVDNGYNSNYDNAYRYADPSMDYAALMYVNAEGGFNTVHYYKNDTSYAPAGVTVTGTSQAPSAGNTLRALYSDGMGWINYSAHGDWNCWHQPSFTTSHINQMSNNDKPSFMIGNCCLSNKFDEGACFGEALLRKGGRAGAIGYIGATNSTFWGEDFYWTVGLRNNVTHTMNLTYDATRKGMYDRLFHTHDEALADHMITAGQMLVAGNTSVARAEGSSAWATAMTEYYWEIYELMGDPSLLPWLGRAATLSISAVKSGDHVVLDVPAGAYVALVEQNALSVTAATFADTTGSVTLPLPAGNDNELLVSVTAQGYRPYINNLSNIMVGIDDELQSPHLALYPNPASDLVLIDGLPHDATVQLYDMQGRLLLSQHSSPNAHHSSLDVSPYPAGLYMLRILSANSVMTKKLVIEK